MTSSVPTMSTLNRWKLQVFSNVTDNYLVSSSDSSATGTAIWVFITIGVAVFILIVVITSLVIFKSKAKSERGQKSSSNGENTGCTKTLINNSMRYGHTDVPKTNNSFSTCFAPRRDQVEDYENVPLGTVSVRKIFQREDIQTQVSIVSERADIHYPYAEVINRSESTRGTDNCHLLSCIGFDEKERNVKRALSSSNLFNNRQDDGNKLRGGNGDFQRRYVDMDFVHVNDDMDTLRRKYRTSTTRSTDQDVHVSKSNYRRSHSRTSDQDSHWMASKCRTSDRARNGSNTSSSARSYISIPPTSPSENYIEAGSDDMSLRSERSTPPIKTAWLTKNLKTDARNELYNYQTSLGTQTESDSDVTSPKCKTVFGTPWQFGGTFTSRGGKLQAKDSDVCLVVVANAVAKADYVDIYGAVFTDTIEIRKKLDFPAKESLITPVVEYHAVPSSSFNRHVCVQLPHALPEEFNVNLIKVYTFTVDDLGKVSLYTVPMYSKANDDRSLETFWEKGSDGCSIFINTTHFSGYFCTLCKTSSLPSICTMVFGSHVQIAPSRREVRVILYIWDRRLTIKDYLERFRKEESDVDRQLLTDMQVPLLNDASSDSRLLMKMEVMGEDEDRQSWRHVPKPDGSRPLFKPLQVRKLNEIVHCCRQTDPIRVEWALENAPRQIPSSVFQCCIDIMHVNESTSDYETAMREGSDELMRTFYVRDLKVMTHSSQDLRPRAHMQPVDLKKILLEITNVPQTEKICQEFGISGKDIGNFKKKYTTMEAFQIGLVEECLNRHSFDKFVTQLPDVLERLNLIHVLTALENRKVFYKVDKDPSVSQPQAEACVQPKIISPFPNPNENLGDDEDSTLCKTPYCRKPSPSPGNKSSSSINRSREDTRGSQKSDLQHQLSQKSDDVFLFNSPSHQNPASAGYIHRNVCSDADSKHQLKLSRHRPGSPQSEHNDNYEEKQVNNQAVGYTRTGIQAEKNQKSSSSRGDSVLRSSSIQSIDNVIPSSCFPSTSTLNPSLVAHADPLDFAEPYPDEFLDDCLRQTYKKELAVQRNAFGPFSAEYASHQYNSGRLNVSANGPHALSPQSGEANHSSVSDPVAPYKKSQKDKYEKSQPQDKDQTLKKEMYGMHTLV
ncbi:hypothetical protein BsWGS_01265 [Bradybaena similaris]